ncbi:hypothetical protein QUW56_05525 [Phocaeicola barnesiae]|uniref:hypothetical protein n=1 Tax=Phocaeicola barnesiae TaxID=376804 RepID=UPI0025A3FDC2|nr:hypothetical protein [Phocaeicola barnesiae]MDM8232848.1 hypothetical protein [Phocaeicola barnesiae]
MRGKVIWIEDGVNEEVEYGTGCHIENSYNHWVSATVRDRQGEEYDVDITDDVYAYFDCERLSRRMIGEVINGLKGVIVDFYYDEEDEEYLLDGDLSDYM